MTHVRIVEEVPGVSAEEQFFVAPDREFTPVGEWLPGFEKFTFPKFADAAGARSFCEQRGWTVTRLEPFEP